jgi:toxin-antitoxin system PIN domain toxin
MHTTTPLTRGSARWLTNRSWATCPITQCGFIRISANPAVTTPAVTMAEALAALRRIVALSEHVFWQDHLGLHESPAFSFERLRGYRQVTDAYLLASALDHGGQLATMDQATAGLAKTPRERAAIVIVPT